MEPAPSPSMTITNTTITGNSAAEAGGGIYEATIGESVNSTFVYFSLTLHSVTITSNTSSDAGGGIWSASGLTIDSSGASISNISNNTAGNNGGGLLFAGGTTTSVSPLQTASLTQVNITGNTASSATANDGLGGGVYISGFDTNTSFSNFTMSYSRLSGNKGAPFAGGSSIPNQIYLENNNDQGGSPSITVTDNWWGTNSDPTAGTNPLLAGRSCGTNCTGNANVTYLPYIVFTMDAPSSTPIKIGTTSTLTADVAHDSSGGTAGLSGHLAAFNNLPVTFSSGAGGSISTAQPVDFSSSGSTTSTFLAGGSGASVTASAMFDGVTVSTTIVVLQPPSMTMSFSPTLVKPNTASTLTFSITNGNTVAMDANFIDSLPSGLHVATPNGLSNGCGGTVTATAGTTSIGFTNASVPAGTCTIMVNVVATADNTYTDSTTVDSTSVAGNGNTPSATLTVSNPPTLVKAFSPTTIPVNGTTTMTITVSSTNTNLSLTGVGFVDTLPSGLAVASPSNLNNTCSGTASAVSNVNLSGATLSPGTNCAVTVSMKGTTAASILNSVTPTSTNGGNGTAGSATLTVVAPPTIGKSFGLSTIALNATTSLSFTLSNLNSVTNTSLSGIGFTDNLPSGLKVASPSNGLTGSCGGGTISATAGGTAVSLSGATLAGTGGGSSCTFSVNVTGVAAGQQTNVTSAVTSTEGGTGLTASAVINVEAPPSISKAFGAGSIALNASTNLTFTITNPAGNPASLTGVGFTDTIPTGLTVASATSSHCGGTLTVTAPVTIALAGATVAVGSPCTFAVSVTGATAGAYTNTTGNVTSTNGGTGNTATANLGVGTAPSISKSFSPTSVALASTSTLTFGITNPSASLALTGLAFTDTFPSGMVVASTPNATNTCGGSVTATGGAGSVSLTGGSLATSASCAVSVSVQGNSTGTLPNSVQVTSTNGGTGNTSNASLTVVSPPTISKSFGAASIAVGSSTSLSFSLLNINSGTTLHGIGFTDTLPSGLLISSPNGLTGSCGGGAITATAGASSLSLSGAVLAAGSSCAFSVNVTGTAAGTENNVTSAVTSTEGGTGITASASVKVEAPPSIAKSFASGGIALNASTNLTFTITNPAGNPASLTGVGFTDTIPTGLTVASATSSQCGGTVTVTAPVTIALANATVAVGTPCTFSVLVTGASTGSYTNTTGNVTSTNGGTGNTATANLSVGSAPSISKSFSPTSVALGGTSTLTFIITNPSASVALTGLAFTDTFPSGMVVASTPNASNTCGGSVTATGGAGSVSLTGGSLAASASCAVSVSVQGNSVGTLPNSVQVTSTNAGTGNTANASLTVVSPPTISKSFGAASIAVGSSTSLSFSLLNINSGTTLHGIGFTDTLPSGLLISSPNGLTGSCGGGAITATAGASSLSLSGAVLAPGTSCAFSVNVTGTAAGTENNVTSAVTSTEGGTGVTASASVKVVAPPSIAKAFGASAIALNASTNLTFTITNPAGNPASLTGVAFTDTIPTGLTVASATSSQCGGTLTVTAPVTISLANATVAVGTPCTFNVVVTGASTGSYTNTTGNVTSANGGTGNTATANLSVGSAPSISKSFSPTSVALGGTSTLTLTITNPSASVALTGVAFADTLPTGMVVASTPNATNTCGGSVTATSGAGSVSLTGGSIAGAASCVVSVSVQGNSAGTLNNSVQVTSTNGGTGNTANASLTVVSPPTISKSFGASSIPLGGATSLSFTLHNNNGATTLHGIGFTDNLPSGLLVSSPNGLTGSCGGGTIAATAGASSLSLSAAVLASSASCTFSVNVTGTAAGAENNVTLPVTSTEGGTGVTASASLNVEAPPAISKAFGAASIALNATTSLTFTITNPAGNAASLTGVGFTDNIPIGLTVASATSSQCGGTVTVTAPVTIALSNATVATGTPCTFNVSVTGASLGGYTNTTGNVTSTNGGTGNTATAPLTVASSTAVTVTNITSTAANGSYTVGAAIPIQVAFSAAVTVIGTPTLTLNSGGTASYASGSGTATLTFNYTVGGGQTTSGAHLDASSANALSGTIQDSSLNPATLTVPVGGTPGSLASNKAIVIDTTAPVVVSYSVLFGSQSYNVIGSSRTHLPWEIAGIQVVFSKPIAQANANSISGVTVTNFAGLGTNTLTWTISAVPEGNLSTVLAGTGGNTIADAAGNALAGGSGFTQNLKILWGDYNDDGVVNAQDLILLGEASTQPYNIFADLNGDGVVNAADVQAARLRVGTSLP